MIGFGATVALVILRMKSLLVLVVVERKDRRAEIKRREASDLRYQRTNPLLIRSGKSNGEKARVVVVVFEPNIHLLH
jgi:hypothetical protein